ncbi:MarR family winged helix-turn-helix transcriptional regulator [Arthrobacter sp. UM1]|uniref:MarR family winged helix-turn-helix transcriptional regulator n=1 Tax=Arthrobacter sp. UM1 TaxID=2766776 RepID=UPI001CF65E36|nr:MarR family transcriptional regulator [Arthrobacter sp. UM1]MCB4208683.1 MarR family transcriptional regulator [Arthrobacter sp. UM1]
MTREQADAVDEFLTTARRAARDIAGALESEAGLTVDQWRILRRVSEQRAVPMKELGAAVCLANATLSRLVDGLVDRGLLFRTLPDDDRRRILVARSLEGSALCARANAIVNGVRLSCTRSAEKKADAKEAAAQEPAAQKAPAQRAPERQPSRR